MSATHDHDLAQAALRWCGKTIEELSAFERTALKRMLARKASLPDPNAAFDKSMSFGDRLADRVASFGGSWTFIMIFGGVLVAWTAINLILATKAFDPYPFIFLNLMLSMLAAVQAPIIMMSQNRQSAKDRSDASHDYEVNLKAEIEIMALHDKLDQIRTHDLEAMLAKQQEQIALLTRLVDERTK